MAEDSYENDDYIKSIQLFSKLIEFDSSNGEYYYKRGSSYTMILYADSAIKDLKKSAILKYRVASSYHNIGLNYSTINDSLAVYYFEKSLQIRPTDNKTKKLLGECKERLKNKHNRNKVTI
jgi:tetratricopeptide (TPR) repeat protein